MSGQFDEIRREMETMSEEQFMYIKQKHQKEIVREYQPLEYGEAKETGAIVYGYTTVGPDGILTTR